MPELPDVIAYCHALRREFTGRPLRRIDVRGPFLVRTVEPSLETVHDRLVVGIARIGKRIVWHLDEDLHLVVHLMIGGRFHKRKPGTLPRSRNDLAAFQFDQATLMLTEASQRKRASLHVVQGHDRLSSFDRLGLDATECTCQAFRDRLLLRNHTLKRALTDPQLFDGIGNAYSDEILHAARLSPLTWTTRLSEDEVARLHAATQDVLNRWIAKLRTEAEDHFPEKVTAFRPEMAVHGRFGKPCPVCGTAVQRIRYAQNETNYCPRCQTGGKVLADRSLSRLLKGDWPTTIDEWEAGGHS